LYAIEAEPAHEVQEAIGASRVWGPASDVVTFVTGKGRVVDADHQTAHAERGERLGHCLRGTAGGHVARL
jgi:hypothetical protein